MSQITLTQINNGDTPDASILMTNLNALKNRINLGMEADNIAANAVNGSHINLGAYIFKQSKGADVASAGTMTLGNDGNFFDITGTTTITSITAKTAGTVVQLQFDGSLTVTNGSNLKLGADLSTSANTTLSLVSDGTNWYEIGRSKVAVPVNGVHRNLLITRTNATTVAVTADQLVLNDGSTLNSVSFSVAITTAGVGGLDTGTEASNTWYYIYALSASTGIISTSSSAPTGQTTYSLIGAVRNDGSSNFIDFKQHGKEYWYSAWQTIVSGSQSAGSWHSADTTAFVPSGLSNIIRGTQGVANGYNEITNDSSTTATSVTDTVNRISYQNSGAFGSAMYELNIITANTIYCQGAYASFKLYCSGFRINKVG